MSLVTPMWLLLAAVPLVLAGVYAFVQYRRRGYALRLSDLDTLESVAPDRPGWRRHGPAVLVVAALLGLVVALAEPYRRVWKPVDDATVILVMDVSPSMEATDVGESRLDTARTAAVDFVTRLPADARVGIVEFAGTARVVLTPTADREAVASVLERLTTRGGTAVAEAVITSVGLLGAMPDGGVGSVVVFSDGRSTVEPEDADAARVAVDAGIAISTIAIGTQHGVVTSVNGNELDVPVDASALEALALDTGGLFVSATDAGQLDGIVRAVDPQAVRQPVNEELAWLFVVGAIVVMTLASAGSLRWFARLP